MVITATDLKIKDFDDYYEVGVKEVLSKPTQLCMIDKVITKYGGRLKKAYPIDISLNSNPNLLSFTLSN